MQTSACEDPTFYRRILGRGGLVEFSELEGSSVMSHPTHLRNVQLSNSNLEKGYSHLDCNDGRADN